MKGEEKKFTDPEELIKYLKTSEDAQYMWSDSEDFAVLADMYHIKIKIISTKGSNDKEPTVYWVYPDSKLEDFAELKNVDLVDITILHQEDIHFDLVVAGDSDLATLGSLSYRFNIGPMTKELEDVVIVKEGK